MTTMKDLCIPAKNPADLHKCPEFIFHTKYHTFYILLMQSFSSRQTIRVYISCRLRCTYYWLYLQGMQLYHFVYSREHTLMVKHISQ